MTIVFSVVTIDTRRASARAHTRRLWGDLLVNILVLDLLAGVSDDLGNTASAEMESLSKKVLESDMVMYVICR